MRTLVSLAFAVSFLVLALSADGSAAQQRTRKSTPARSASKSAASARKRTTTRKASTATRKRTAAKRKTTSRKRVSRRSTRKKPIRRTTWRNRQTQPTPERYREIQDALAAKGYLNREDANGSWGQSSVDALKKFQADQKLGVTGKIDSLSLIALGLGPKHETAAAPKPPGAPVQP